jgi:hypothetical protein
MKSGAFALSLCKGAFLMKKIIVIFLFFIAIKSVGQNLVPNGGFESYYNCSNEYYLISNATNWWGSETPDYFNSCIVPTTSSFSTDIPLNSLGFQYAKNENAYAGFGTYYGPYFREHIYNKLFYPLITNKLYCVSFSVSLADSAIYAIKKIGAYISEDSIVPPYVSTSSPPFYSFTYYIPQIESNSFITDTNNWTQISGIFLAQGNEEYISIGNFRDGIGTDTLRVRNTSTYPYSYYYIDDVSVEEVLNADAGPDAFLMQGDSIQLGNNPTENAGYSWFPSTGLSDPNAPNPKASPSSTITYVLTKTQCNVVTRDTVLVDITVGMNSDSKTGKIKIFPNPSGGVFTLEANLKNSETGILKIYDLTGSLVTTQSISSGISEINLESLQNGIYHYEMIIDGKSIQRDKLIIIK